MTDFELQQEIAGIKANVTELTRTVRNILTLASNYGFAGYVDISAHDQDPNAHATNPNFVTLGADGHQLRLGRADEIGKGYNKPAYPIELGRDSIYRQAQDWRVESAGRIGYDPSPICKFMDVYSTDADGNKASASKDRQMFTLTQLSYHTAAADPDLFAAWKITSGSIEETSAEASAFRKKTSILIDLTAGIRGQHKNILELSYTSILPCVNNQMNLGSGQHTFANTYLNASPTILSDAREKTDISNVPDAVLDAWGEVNWEQFRMVSAVEEKGLNARTHTGLVAQRIDEVFRRHGLDACKYGLLCHDSWEARPEQMNEKGEVVFEAVEAGDKWSVRYEEALAMEATYQRREVARLRQRLEALEAKQR